MKTLAKDSSILVPHGEFEMEDNEIGVPNWIQLDPEIEVYPYIKFERLNFHKIN